MTGRFLVLTIPADAPLGLVMGFVGAERRLRTAGRIPDIESGVAAVVVACAKVGILPVFGAVATYPLEDGR